MNLKIFLRVFGLTAIVLTIFPFIPVDNWSVRVFDFPHLQLTLLTMLALLTYFLKFELDKKSDYLFVIALTACFLFQAGKIYPYTKFAKFEVQNPTEQNSPSLKIYSANVLQKNKEWELLKNDIENHNPDLLVFTETDVIWRNRLHPHLSKNYKYNVEAVLDNTYGMLLYSRYPLNNYSVKYMVEDTIPSIHTELILPTDNTIQIYAIHPAPPTPQHNPSSVDRDSEMMKIAKLARESNLPVIVLGDFNDVAWSETTALFQAVSGLLDLRKGRGLYSTYNAKNWIMRWPLDHVFSSPEFRLKEVKRGGKFGSDHFPFYCELSYEPDGSHVQKLDAPTKNQLKEAFDQIENEVEDENEKVKEEKEKAQE